MIHEEDVYKIGVLTRTHGVSGEVSMTFTDDVFDRVDADYLVCRMDGILVPFFMEEYRFKSDTTVLVKFEGIDDADCARRMVGVEVYFPKSLTEEVPEGELAWSYFTGFTLEVAGHGVLGSIAHVNDDTMNVLFEVVTPEGTNLLIPAVEDFMEDIDHRNRVIRMMLPEGLLDLNESEERSI